MVATFVPGRFGPIVQASTAGGGGGGGGVAWDPGNAGSNITFANSNLDALKASGAAGWSNVLATVGKSSGKRYFEITIAGSVEAIQVGVSVTGEDLNSFIGGGTFGEFGYDRLASYTQTSGFTLNSTDALTPAIAHNDVIGFAIDLGAGLLWMSKNGSYTAFSTSANPGSGTHQVASFTGLTLFPCVAMFGDGGGAMDMLLTASSGFATAPPSGFVAWGP